MHKTEERLRSWLLPWLPVVVALGAAMVIWPGVRTSVPVQVSGAQAGIYGPTAGAAGTLLGFSLAALSFLLSLPQDSPLMRRLRAESAYELVLRRFATVVVYMALTLLVALAGLFIDRQPDASLHASKLGIGAYWIWAVLVIGGLGVLRVASALVGLLGVVPVTIAAGHGRRDRRPH